jgi:hypothetical protein
MVQFFILADMGGALQIQVFLVFEQFNVSGSSC